MIKLNKKLFTGRMIVAGNWISNGACAIHRNELDINTLPTEDVARSVGLLGPKADYIIISDSAVDDIINRYNFIYNMQRTNYLNDADILVRRYDCTNDDRFKPIWIDETYAKLVGDQMLYAAGGDLPLINADATFLVMPVLLQEGEKTC